MSRIVMRRATRLLIPVAIAWAYVTTPTLAAPLYTRTTLIGVPASAENTAGGSFATYDISSFDPSTRLDYIADRSNAAVDIISTTSNSFVGQIGGTGATPKLFVGQLASNDFSGPDGALAINSGGQHQLYVGDGNSTLKSFTIPSNTFIGSVSTGPASNGRVDELAFDPSSKQALATNPAASPSPILNFVSTTSNSVVGQITLDGKNGTPNATGGVEQPAYDSVTGKFYVSVPEINGKAPGGIAEIDPTSRTVTKVFDLASFGISACGPTGLAQGANGKLIVGCGVGGTQSIVLDPTANGGAGTIKSIPQISGEDQVAYDPVNNRYFLAARLNPGGPVLGVIDANTDLFLENDPTTPGDHSVAVDTISGRVFVPFGGIAGNTVCPAGCVAVFEANATNVPEPSSLPLLVAGLVGLTSLGLRHHSRRSY